MAPLLLALPGNEAFAQRLSGALGTEIAKTTFHRFPDGETFVRIETPVIGRAVVILCTLDRPDAKFLPLLFAAQTARELGATAVGLVAPYLGYMRQDTRFKPGEAVTSQVFARTLSGAIDWLVTVDPHLHRWPSLSAIYNVPARAVHAAPLISEWIKRNVQSPYVIGPDEESKQWASEIATAANAPYAVLKKERRGDTSVDITLPPGLALGERVPVLVDDIISSGRTMIAAARQLRNAGAKPPVCAGIHAVFAGDAFAALTGAGISRIATTNTIAHETSALDVSAPVAAAVREFVSA
jgi:ribose-phosphate pyrophosphokinase